MAQGKKQSYKEFCAELESNPKARQKLFKSLLDHLKEGLSFESFYLLETQRLKDLLTRYKHEFDDDEILISCQEGRDWWERLGKAQANGQNLGNSRAWWYNMVHRYGWSDKVEVKATHDGTVNVNIVSYADTQSKQQS